MLVPVALNVCLEWQRKEHGTHLGTDVHQLAVGYRAAGDKAANGGAEEGEETEARSFCCQASVRAQLAHDGVEPPSSCQAHQSHQDTNICQAQGFQST